LSDAVIKLGIAGAAGRMGRALIEACHEQAGLRVAAAWERANSSALGRDAGELAGVGCLGVAVSDRVEDEIAGVDVVIDFTSPVATEYHLSVCRCSKTRMVIGTTGLGTAARAAIKAAAEDCAIVCAPNMSVGVNLCFRLLQLAARTLDDFDVEIVEAHHRQKVDAPSGTALRMGEIVAQARGHELPQCAVYAREGQTGVRDPKTIGFATVRAGDIVGEHTVVFGGMGERVEIAHKATNRSVFAHGALRAARWLTLHERGLFDMQDVLGLR
jgi:4-hydroxy-tetrahydrodipicolinate reductase